MKSTMLVIAPCLLSPYTVYRGAVEKDLEAAAAVRGLLGRRPEVEVLAYPCPEFILLGFPRPPATVEMYERLGLGEVAARVAAFIERVIAEEEPRRVVLVGVKGSPTCAAFTTTSGDPDACSRELLDRFPSLPKGERLELARKIARSYRPREGPGILFDLLRRRVTGTYLDFDKGRITASVESLEAALR
ncbi:hypothetical protein ACVNPS_00755 [Candidatus Bipolaricaulota sp. J31]